MGLLQIVLRFFDGGKKKNFPFDGHNFFLPLIATERRIRGRKFKGTDFSRAYTKIKRVINEDLSVRILEKVQLFPKTTSRISSFS